MVFNVAPCGFDKNNSQKNIPPSTSDTSQKSMRNNSFPIVFVQESDKNPFNRNQSDRKL
ncbi:MAG: hypothetical protein SCALA701_27990 [Candidatus Scalindua sp.]|nr:MAG: hypothetical protein SCALA701_27990 [Candidatus Scalindua sp.]